MNSGAGNPNWKGGRVRGAGGRWLVYSPGHPFPNTQGSYVFEYRLVAEQKIGRYLLPGEVVHHIDGDAHNNAPENLTVMSQSEHARLHIWQRRDPNTGRILPKGAPVPPFVNSKLKACAVCGSAFRPARSTHVKTCGPDCSHEFRSRQIRAGRARRRAAQESR